MILVRLIAISLVLLFLQSGSQLRAEGVGPVASACPTTATSDHKHDTQADPPNDGFLGDRTEVTLAEGQLIDRYGGSPYSEYFSPPGTPPDARSLPPGVREMGLHTYLVVRSFNVEYGIVAPWYGQPGFGKQYRSLIPLGQLLCQGYMREIFN
jgi:hypothetical protein